MSVLGEMTSGFAHELNQPLSAIRHYAQGCLIRLQSQDPTHTLLSALEHIDQQAQRGAETLRNLRRWVSQAQEARFVQKSGRTSVFTRRFIMSGSYCAWRSSSRR